PAHLVSHGGQSPVVPGHRMVAVVAREYRAEPPADVDDAVVDASSQLDANRLQLCALAFRHRLPAHREPSASRFPAVVREAEEVEGLWLPFAPPLPSFRREAAKLDETGLLGVELQGVLPQLCCESHPESLCVGSMLETHHE